ncbi:MAG: GyrI-like domain-containing protein [Candidatus Hodarchaeales archaeon]|jgi:hypothetical protein
MPVKKSDLKKQFPMLYNPARDPHIIDIPDMWFFMVDGTGHPGNNPLYQEAMQLLYGASFTLKMSVMKPLGKDYVVPPLEGLWWAEDMTVFTKSFMEKKDEWKWTSMIRIPDFVEEEQIKKALRIFKEKKNPENIHKIRYEKYSEGTVVQVLHLGPYSEEGPIINNMHKYAGDNGYLLHNKHHEIYLSDPRRTKPEKLRTVIRQPIKKK